jgi:hypothetical protein
MAKFKTYGQEFDVGDPFQVGMALDEKTSRALNNLRAEFISHRVRSGPFKDTKVGDTLTQEQIDAAQAFVADAAAKFEFGAERVAGPARVADPVEVEAFKIARQEIRAKLADAKLKLGKKGEAAGEGEYAYERFEQKVAEVAALEKVIAKAKKIVAARKGAGADVEVEL